MEKIQYIKSNIKAKYQECKKLTPYVWSMVHVLNYTGQFFLKKGNLSVRSKAILLYNFLHLTFATYYCVKIKKFHFQCF